MNHLRLPAKLWAAAFFIISFLPGQSIWAQESLSELFDKATLELTYFNFDTAYSLFDEVQGKAHATDPDLWQRATLGRALAAQCRTPATSQALDEAQQQYTTLSNAAPESIYAARALLQLGRIAEVRDFGEDVVDLDTARDYYRRVYEGWRDQPIADEAALRYADTYFQQFEAPSTVARGMEFLESWTQGRAGQPMESVLWEVIASVKQDQLKDHRGALDAFLKAEALGFAESNLEGILLYRAAQLAENELADIDTAVRLYQKVITNAPRSGRAFNSQLALQAIQAAHPAMTIDVPQIKMFLADDGADAPEQERSQ